MEIRKGGTVMYPVRIFPTKSLSILGREDRIYFQQCPVFYAYRGTSQLHCVALGETQYNQIKAEGDPENQIIPLAPASMLLSEFKQYYRSSICEMKDDGQPIRIICRKQLLCYLLPISTYQRLYRNLPADTEFPDAPFIIPEAQFSKREWRKKIPYNEHGPVYLTSEYGFYGDGKGFVLLRSCGLQDLLENGKMPY